MDIQFEFRVEPRGFDPDADKIEASFIAANRDGVDKFFDAIEKEWRDQAKSTFNTSQKKYLDGLTFERVGDTTMQVTIEGFLPVALEQGVERFDMKDGLLQGRPSRVIPIGKENGTPTFRTVTRTSPGWWHPGIQANPIHEKVFKAANEKILSDVFEPLMSRVQV